MMGARARIAAGGMILLGCGSPARSEAPTSRPAASTAPAPSAGPAPPEPEQSSQPEPAAARPKGCERGPPPERVEVELGKTVVTHSGVAVTFKAVSHDSYDDGRSDLLLHLVFQGVGDDGKLTPSAFSWMPSALATPAWTLLGVNRCARVVSPGEQRVVLELFRPARDSAQ